MNRDEFLRFALIVGDGQASTFKTNLQKIILSVLSDNYGTPLTVPQICTAIKTSFELEFTDEEILENITPSRKFPVNIKQYSTDPRFNTYSISPDEYQKRLHRGAEISLTSSIIGFLSTRTDCPFSADALESIITEHIYKAFNSNVQTVLSLINDRNYSPNTQEADYSSDSQELNWINAFLNWDNSDKDKTIFLMVSACHEYCMMTVRKDNSSFKSLFSGKEFFLDTNIILRMIGFNNNDRKESIQAFIQKCHSCKITLRYTNFTNVEIERTLTSHVNDLERFLGSRHPIGIVAFRKLCSHGVNFDLYNIYVEWTKKPKNRAGDYQAFLRFLKQETNRCFDKMVFAPVESKETSINKTEFETLVQELVLYKDERRKNVSTLSAKTDIENYLYLLSKEKDSRSNSFLEKKHYFVTADHALISWAKQKRPGVIPTFVLPSLWYSLMLKYSGRTNDDFSAYCQFLTLPIYHTTDDLSDKKEKMLAEILSLDESVDVKEAIIFDIDERLTRTDEVVNDPIEFVKESISRVIDSKIEEGRVALKEELSAEFDEKINKLQDQSESAAHEQYESGKNEGINKIINASAARIIKRNTRIRKVANILALCGFSVVVIAIIIYALAKLNVNTAIAKISIYSDVIGVASFVVSIFALLIKPLTKHKKILPVDIDVIVEKLHEQYKNDDIQ